jgi:hypothetical protein
MKVSNFIWTDKDSKRWFILLPNGHTGPYSLSHLLHLYDQKKIFKESKIWSVGLEEAVAFKTCLDLIKSEQKQPQVVDADELPPPVPTEKIKKTRMTLELNKRTIRSKKLILICLISLMFSSIYFLKMTQEEFYFSRLNKMSPNLHQRILKENIFEGWQKGIFFKEYFAHDHSQIWLVSTGYQRCHVEAIFQSLSGKLLSLKNEDIIFTSQGHLSNHVVELDSFAFKKGVRIIPGVYEVDVRAMNCRWDGLLPWLMNIFNQPEKEYIARTRIVLYPDGAEKFFKSLENLKKKKINLKKREQKSHEALLQDLVMRFQTLEALTSQIEQLFLDFLQTPPHLMKDQLKTMVNEYSRNFGRFLTTFVMESEKSLPNTSSDKLSEAKNYDEMIRQTAKSIGLESMKLIEELQKIKSFTSEKKLSGLTNKVKLRFSRIKKEISQKLLQVSQDQESLQHTL